MGEKTNYAPVDFKTFDIITEREIFLFLKS